MANRYVVDAHALVWFLEGNPRLGKMASSVLVDPGSDLIFPAVALGEACWMVKHGKTKIPSLKLFLGAIDSEPRLTIAPLTPEIVRFAAAMENQLEMHDSQIVATTLLLGRENSVALITKDVMITNSKLVEVVW